MTRVRWLTILILMPCAAGAHSFGRHYTLPVPVWLYLYGAAAALVLSFLVVACFVNARTAETNFRTLDLSANRAFELLTGAGLRGALQVLSVASLWFCIVCGLWGTQNAYANFNMTFFWILFVLGFSYVTALLGDLYAALNPWWVMTRWLAQLLPRLFVGRRPYPQQLAYWPALLLYMTFIWIELFAQTKPGSLSWILLGYTAVNMVAAWWWGSAAWFRYGEFFAVFLRLLAKMSVFEWRRDAQGRGRLQLRQPFIGLLQERAESFSLLLFVLFMLSSTAFDGLRDTAPWVKLFWKDLYVLLTPYVGDNIVESYALLEPLYLAWQSLALLLSPFVYLALYLLFIALAKGVTRSKQTVRALALQFAFTLLPIALVYHLSHYYTLLIGQGSQLLRLASDPFGWGWDLFGSAQGRFRPLIVAANVVWHTQVWLILFGHIVSVYLAHLVALRTFSSSRQATLSQLPMLLLMVAFTTIGLWILSLPISPAQWTVP